MQIFHASGTAGGLWAANPVSEQLHMILCAGPQAAAQAGLDDEQIVARALAVVQQAP